MFALLEPPLDDPIEHVEKPVEVERIGVRIDDDRSKVEEIGVSGAYLFLHGFGSRRIFGNRISTPISRSRC